MRNKKAILLPEFLKLSIAVVVIFMLVFLAYQLYNIFIAKSDLEKARETLNQITAKMEGLEEGDKVEYLVSVLKGWNLVKFDKKLCICEEPNEIENCNKKGVCKEIDKKIAINHLCLIVPEEKKMVYECLSFDRTFGLIIEVKGGIINFYGENYLDSKKLLEDFLNFEYDNKKMELVINNFLSTCDDNGKCGSVGELGEFIIQFNENEVKGNLAFYIKNLGLNKIIFYRVLGNVGKDNPFPEHIYSKDLTANNKKYSLTLVIKKT